MMETGKSIFYHVMRLSHKGDMFELEKHTQKVVERCMELAKILNDEIDEEIDFNLLNDSAWLHDIRKLKEGKGKHHHLPSHVRYAIENVVEEDVNDDWLEIIAQHKDDFKPVKYPVESAILRLCDKIDHLRKATKKKNPIKRLKIFNKARKQCKISLKLFKQYGFAKTELNVFKEYYKEYCGKYWMKL